MSTTLKITNGDLDFNDYGQAEVVYGANKAGQDLGEVFTSDLDKDRGWGCGLTPGVAPIQPELYIRNEVASAVGRLQNMQNADRQLDPDERIVGIESLSVKSVGAGSWGWYAAMSLGNGETVRLGGTQARTATAMSQTWPRNH